MELWPVVKPDENLGVETSQALQTENFNQVIVQ